MKTTPPPIIGNGYLQASVAESYSAPAWRPEGPLSKLKCAIPYIPNIHLMPALSKMLGANEISARDTRR